MLDIKVAPVFVRVVNSGLSYQPALFRTEITDETLRLFLTDFITLEF